MATPTQKPIAIPEPTDDPKALWRTTQALKEAVEVIQGQRGNRAVALKSELDAVNSSLTSAIGTGGSGGTGTPTALSLGTRTSTSMGITSDGAVDDVILPEANVAEAGLLSSVKLAEINANTLKVGNATHTGEVTGSLGLVLDVTAITNRTDVTAEAVDAVPIYDDTDGGLKKTNLSSITDAGYF